MIMTRWLCAIGICLPMVCFAQTNNVKNLITVELSGNTLHSNLLYVSPLHVEQCKKFHVLEHHQQTSINDPHISTIEVLAENCEPEYLIQYSFYLVSKKSDNRYCAFQLDIYSDDSHEIPRAEISGDCGYTVSGLKLNDNNEFHYTIS